MFAAICRLSYALCAFAVFEIHGPLDDDLVVSFAEVCGAVGESDRNGELVRQSIGPFVLHTGFLGQEIFLRGDGRVYGYVRHHDPDLVRRCEKLLEAVFSPRSGGTR